MLGMGCLGVSFRRLKQKLLSRRIWLSISGVAFAIALMLVITSVGLGFASQNTVSSEGVDYWIVPASASSSTNVVSVGGSSLGDVHPANEKIKSIQGVNTSTPVLMKLTRLNSSSSERSKYGVLLGVIPDGKLDPIYGVSPRKLSPGDPYYDSNYTGEMTGEVVLSNGAAKLLDTGKDGSVWVEGKSQRFDVINVNSDNSSSSVFRELPVAVFHLSELQKLTNTYGNDEASQILVKSQHKDVKKRLSGVYPEANVVKKGGVNSQSLMDQQLPLALMVASLIVALVVGVLFVGTTMGLEITYDRPQIALLAALGYSGWTRIKISVYQTLMVTVIGGAIGVVLGVLGIYVVEELATSYLEVQSLTQFHPILVAYGVAVSVIIGLMTTPYIVYVVKKTDTLKELNK